MDYWMHGLLARGKPRDDMTQPTIHQSINLLIH